MLLSDKIKQVKTKEGLIQFMQLLSDDAKRNPHEWVNPDISSYIESIMSWTEDMDGYYENMRINIPSHIDWGFIATLLYVGKIYE